MTTFNDKKYSFQQAILELHRLRKLGFNPTAFIDLGDEYSIYILLDDDGNITKRICTYFNNIESQLNISDIELNFYIAINVKLYGSNHSNFKDETDESMYIREINISSELDWIYDEAAYSDISWEDFEPGVYSVMTRDIKSGANQFGGFLNVKINEDGDKIGYISDRGVQ